MGSGKKEEFQRGEDEVEQAIGGEGAVGGRRKDGKRRKRTKL